MRAKNWRRIPFFCALIIAISLALAPASADDKPDKKEEKKPDPPRVAVALPLALKTGTTNKIVIRGLNLTNVTKLRFTNETVKASIVLGKKTKAEVPKESDAKKVGDTQVTAEIFLPTDTSLGTNWFTLTSPDGVSDPKPLVFLPPADLIEEKEPNGGFREAQSILTGQTVSGTIKEVGDVDVFRIEGKAGQIIRLDIFATAGGSALDSLITLYDGNGRLLASNDDDGGGRDSLLETKLTVTGTHYVTIMDANDKAGPTHVYLLRTVSEQ